MHQPGKYVFTRKNYLCFEVHGLRLEAKTGVNDKTKLTPLYTSRSAYTAVVSALTYMEADGNGKAWSYMLSIQRFDFIITLVTFDNIYIIII